MPFPCMRKAHDCTPLGYHGHLLGYQKRANPLIKRGRKKKALYCNPKGYHPCAEGQKKTTPFRLPKEGEKKKKPSFFFF